MDFYERIDRAFQTHKVNRAQVGREIGISGQAVTMKLQRKSAVTQREIEILAHHARMTVSEALGESAVVLEKKDEQSLIELYRALTPEQRMLLLTMGQQLAPNALVTDPPAE